MVQQVQEKKGGVSFGQVAGAAVAGTSVGLLGNHVVNGMNQAARITGGEALKNAPKGAEEAFETVKSSTNQLAEYTNNIRQFAAKQGDEIKKVAEDFSGEKGGEIVKNVKSIANEAGKITEETAGKIAEDLSKKVNGPFQESGKEGSREAAKITSEMVKENVSKLNDKFSEGMKGLGALNGKQKALIVGAAAIATIGTMMALAPKSKVEEPQHDGMVQGRGQSMAMA